MIETRLNQAGVVDHLHAMQTAMGINLNPRVLVVLAEDRVPNTLPYDVAL